ncbi:Cytochrome c oxidase subunit 5C-2 [Micractinium conductrix]|uniref:Cytochrome c oxidase subunit 5C-2 n=1 Tax=Micractinium conductrix TaxID=554055 RepID=A0A2P6VLA0_9CHLO|nr:Cytochrome c oxidase subunit 5C-2 [Micractinium conductrix]|eukprot:PSC74840.1 Cytochrome c oxidase subunit 5C-2 [Micractinium conductrix]
MSGKAVIKAAQMFTKTGQASRISVTKEILIGSTLGAGLGFWWQTYHWNEAKKWENFYKAEALKRQGA